MRQKIQKLVLNALKNLYGIEKDILVDIPKDESADYSVNTALQCSKELGKNSKDIAQEILKEIKDNDEFEKIEIAEPGFIYFTLKKESLIDLMLNSKESWRNEDLLKGQKIMVEFAHPNTHKAFHIGHLRNICLGESLVRLLESQEGEIFRANYQGDIGPHVAKCLWALKQEKKEIIEKISKSSPQEKAEFLGKMYAKGGSTYEKDEASKSEILKINKIIYEENDESIINLYKISRQWSLDYFDFIYERLGTKKFDRLFFESEVWESGKEIVEKNTGKVFKESNGAVVFEGEDFGLHTRVFISSEGNPTYEAKEMGLAVLQKETFDYDKNIHVVANEQATYFKVVIEAMYQIFPELKGRQEHLSYGMVKLTSGKMSSRTGDVITAEWLIDEAKAKILKILEDRGLTKEEKEDIADKVAIGAIKFTMLHTMAKNDIAFDLEKAVRLDGDSGPYLQYAHARICSILSKTGEIGECFLQDFDEFNEYDWKLLKKIQYFPYHVSRSAKEMSPHHLTHYLLKLVSEFSSWYSKNSVQNAESDSLKIARIELLKFLRTTLKKALYLLGIEAPEKM